ncbi:phospholipase C, phosphocholine-specific [Longispora fulva]|uniref:phospholipase C n=1 Tax=Longispora fulva TaxID=619741 RepID=A0A8J7GQF1_9ACTN|nr:phospholipase C, phosphocholine-specific [Longispora fulva]MBG6138740.1 phospholipase C [Longispora fulva]GIG58234.1 phospholipase C, phosphocholine-specific [Longispora fulva]
MERRTFLRAGAATATAAAAFGLLPDSVRQALAMAAPTGGLEVIEHVVILMQENRSFDHYYGTLRGVRGFNDPAAITLPGGASVFRQPNGTGYVLPYPVHDQYMDGCDHSWGGGHAAWNNGRYDKWVPNKSVRTMTTFRRGDLPFYFALADAFTICDSYHCSEFGPTNPNRNYLFTGTVGNEPDGRRAIDNDAYGANHAGYSWTTYAERLEAAGRSWRVYQEWDNYTDNPLEFFVTFMNVARKALASTGYTKVEAFYNAVQGAAPAQQDVLLGKLAQGVATLTAAERSLYDRALRRERTGQLAAAFRADVAADRLPAVSWLVANYQQSEHPSSGPNNGAELTRQLLDALASNPAVWNKTVFLLTYDENDGFFDHVPPPTAPVVGDGSDGMSTVSTAGEIALSVPIGLGVRVPMIVVSPWSRGGAVCSQVFDHTSVIQFLEKWTGVAEPNISAWRRAVCGDLTAALDLTSANAAFPSLPTPVVSTGPRPTSPTPPASQALPAQEPGVRPARPLPYSLSVAARVTSGTVFFDFGNAGAAGAHFSVYANAYRTDGPWRYTVEAGKTLTDTFTGGTPTGAYDLTAHGPNGFVRRFVGNRITATNGGANPEVTLRYSPAEGRVYLRFVNTGGASCVFTVRAGNRPGTWSYPVAAGANTEDFYTVGGTNNWYDLTVTGPDGFLRRFAGHMETGAVSTSDPVMGSGRLAGTVRYVDSEETVAANNAAVNAVDGSTTTIWHTAWSGGTLPHEIQLDLGASRTVTGVSYLPRQSGVNGRIGAYEMYLSSDGNTWGSPVATGVFADDATEKVVRCWPTAARYVRLRALTEAGGRGAWTSAAEIAPLGW